MISLTIPGQNTLALEHLLLDLNGTLTVDGACWRARAHRPVVPAPQRAPGVG